jgi:hypothetical protein
LKEAPGVVTAAALPPEEVAASRPGGEVAADAAILAMVGGEQGLLGALDTLDRLRQRVAGVLSTQDPTAMELRALGSMERTLRALVLYLEQVATELDGGGVAVGPAAAVPFPAVPELVELEGEDELVAEVRQLVERTSEVHAALDAAQE